MEIEEIKNMWKKQTTESTAPGKGKNSDILDVIYSMEKKTKRKYIIATTAMALELSFFLYLIIYSGIFRGLSLAGAVLIILAIIFGGVSIWSTNILFKKDDLINPGKIFLKEIIEKLQRRRFLRIYVIPVYLVMIAFGLSMIFSEHLAEASLFLKILAYSASYLYMLIIYIITARKEIRKEKNEIEPIRKKITALIMQMESD